MDTKVRPSECDGASGAPHFLKEMVGGREPPSSGFLLHYEKGAGGKPLKGGKVEPPSGLYISLTKMGVSCGLCTAQSQ